MREYHCNEHDVHIVGPSDEIADDIDAHEELHHADTASKADDSVEITPELVDAVADWWEARGAHAGVQRLRTEASHLRREQADEKRIDELAQIYADAFGPECDVATWDHAADFLKNAYRAGIRAVLAKLDEDEAAEARAAFGDEQCTPIRFDKGGWGEFDSYVPVNRDTVYGGSKEPEQVLKDGWGDPEPDPAEDQGQHEERTTPRGWDDLRYVPATVERVSDKFGRVIVRDRNALCGWVFPREKCGVALFEHMLTDRAPYMEIPTVDDEETP
jgi:hypothetical protein